VKAIILFAIPPHNINHGAYPYGFALIGTMAKQAGHEIYSLIAKPNENNSEFCLRYIDFISEKNINVVALSSTSIRYPEVKYLIEQAKNKNCITVLGGFIVSAQPELIMANIGADFCVYGEGEYTFLELIDALENDRDRRAIDGLLYLENGIVIKNRPRSPVQDLDKLPFLDLELFDFSEFSQILMLIGSRSCPYGCTFCYRSPDIPYRQRNLDSLFLELDYFLQHYGHFVKELQIQDDLFMLNKARVLEFCERIKPYNLPFSIQGRVDFVDEEVIKALKEAGCYLLEFGLESINDNILESMNKKITSQQIRLALELSVKHGIMPFGVFIFGDKEDDAQTIQNSLQFYLENISKYWIHLSPIILFPGSDIYNFAVSKGIILDEVDFLEKRLPYKNVSKLTEEQYQLFLRKIDFYKKAKRTIAHTPIVTQYNSFSINRDGSMSIVAYCPMCDHKIYFSEVMLETLLKPTGRDCQNCGNMFIWTELPMIKTFQELNDDCEKYNEFFSGYKGRILVYGMNDTIKFFFHAIHVFRQKVVKIVDKYHEYYKNDLFCGLKIESPTSLHNILYDLCIVSDVGLLNEAKTTLTKYGLPIDNVINWDSAIKQNILNN